MSKRPNVMEEIIADRLYCLRLVAVAFPSKVWIGRTSYGEEELRATLSGDAVFKRRVARKYWSDAEKSTDDDLAEKAFPKSIEFEGNIYDRNQLLEALLGSPTMQKLLAEQYHYASNELYLERLVEMAFRRGQKHESVRIGSKRYKHQDLLRKALQDGTQNFREQIGWACGYPRSVWWLELYCKRLVEVAFPKAVEVEGRSFDRVGLRDALKDDKGLIQRVAMRLSLDRESVGVEELINELLPLQLEIGDKVYLKE